jgi:hypothetical protein
LVTIINNSVNAHFPKAEASNKQVETQNGGNLTNNNKKSKSYGKRQEKRSGTTTENKAY